MKYLALAATTALTATTALAETPVLTVYTYDSFVSDWGPGPKIEEAFEAVCNCDLNLVGAGDGAALLARLKLEGARSDADVVMGLDTGLIAAAKETGLFTTTDVTADYALPTAWTDDTFAPYDWCCPTPHRLRTISSPKKMTARQRQCSTKATTCRSKSRAVWRPLISQNWRQTSSHSWCRMRRKASCLRPTGCTPLSCRPRACPMRSTPSSSQRTRA